MALGNALLCSIACDLPPVGLGAVEHSEQAGVEVAACKPQAGERIHCWPAQWCSGGGVGGQAVAGGTKPGRGVCALAGLSLRGASDGAGLAGSIARPVTERSKSAYSSTDRRPIRDNWS